MENELIEAFEIAEKSIIHFRSVFFPSGDVDEKDPADFHYEWSDIILNGKQHCVVEAFRESGKSQIVIRAHLIYRLVYPSKDCNYILIIMANQKLASKRLKETAQMYLADPVLSANMVKVNEQSEKAFEVVVKDKHGELVTMRYEAYGKGSSIRGVYFGDVRPKLVVIDDPQDLEDSVSDITQHNDYDWFLSDVYFLGQTTRIFMIGNNLGSKCLVERVIDNAEDLKFTVMRIPIMDSNGQSAWPDKWPIKDILEEKERWTRLGKLDVWFREKMCIAVSPEDQIFKKEYFMYYDNEKEIPSDLSIYTTVDLAISEKSEADYSVVMTVGVSRDNHWFILDCTFKRCDPSTLMDDIFEVVARRRPLMVGIEQVAYQKALSHFVMKEMPKRNIYFTIKGLMAEKKKNLRIQTMQPRFAARTVWFPKDASFLTELEAELLSFTVSRGTRSLHDDLIDALAYMEQIALAPAGGYGDIDDDDIPIAGSL